jgi:hypothetical protein
MGSVRMTRKAHAMKPRQLQETELMIRTGRELGPERRLGLEQEQMHTLDPEFAQLVGTTELQEFRKQVLPGHTMECMMIEVDKQHQERTRAAEVGKQALGHMPVAGKLAQNCRLAEERRKVAEGTKVVENKLVVVGKPK